MIGPAAAMVPSEHTGLLEKLLAAVRPEFRVDVLVHDPDDPVLGVPPCAVPDCDRPVADKGICNGHSLRWRKQGRPDLAGFIADPGPPQMGRRELGHCTVRGCRYGLSGYGLCPRHRDNWARAGSLDLAIWAARAPEVDSSGHAECALPFCTIWPEGENIFCKGHTSRWRQGSP